MSDRLGSLGRSGLIALADALSAGRICPPYGRADVAAFAAPGHADAVAETLEDLRRDGMEPRQLARTMLLLAAERSTAQAMSDRTELVWSPPELDQVDCRDTSVVVQDLFRRATRSVLIVTFALDHGMKAEALFGGLAAKMDAEPALSVRVIANIHRDHGDGTPAEALRRAFAARIRDKVWPGKRLPEVFFDARSLSTDLRQHAVLHAKCVVVDERFAFMTSANFTEAAQHRNIELGVLIDDPRVAERLSRQFQTLIERGPLERLL